MSRREQDITDTIFEQASDWVFRMQGAAGDARVRADLDRWLAADPRHDKAWRLARQAWAASGAVAPVFASPSKPPSGAAALAIPAPSIAAAAISTLETVPRGSAGRRPSRGRLAALALAAGLAGLAVLPSLQLRLRADHVTGAGRSETVALADGSQIVLAGGSAIDSRLTADSRAVTLLRGEAFFQVAADRRRPFVVQAGTMTVTVTGTAFDVGVTDSTASVAVAEGTVTVAHGKAEERLRPGQSLIVDLASDTVQHRAVDVADVAAWRQGRLVAGNQTLSTVVDAIRRQHSGFILLTDDALGEKRVTGIYDIGDPERALRALVRPYGGTVRRITPYLLVVSPF